MTKFLRRAVAAGAVLFVFNASASARITGVNPTGAAADTFCVGPVGAEVCMDYLGDVIPTTNLDATIGTTNFYWNSVYASSATLPGGVTLGTVGALNATGLSGSAASQTTTNGITVYKPYRVGTGTGSLGVYSSTSIPVAATYETVISSGLSSCSITAVPSIATATVVGGATSLPNGTFLVLSSTAGAGVILQDEGTLTGSKLQLGAATREVKVYKTLTLVYDALDGYWREISYGNN